MASCPACGGAVDPDYTYCPDCGAALAATDGSTPTAPTADATRHRPDARHPTVGTTGAAPQSSSRHGTTYVRLTLVGVGVTILGTFLPWASILGTSIAGVEGNGLFCLLFGLLAAGVVWRYDWTRRTHITMVVLGGLIAFVPLYDMESLAPIGLYLTLIGGLIISYAGVRGLRS